MAAAGRVQSFAHPVEDVAGLLLDGEHGAVGQGDADLFAGEPPPRFVKGEDLEDYQQAVAEILGLRPVVGVEQILQGQGVQAEILAELLHHRDIVDAEQVDPVDPRLMASLQALPGSQVVPALELLRGVADQLEPGRFQAPFADVQQGSRRLPDPPGDGFVHPRLLWISQVIIAPWAELPRAAGERRKTFTNC